MLVHHALPILRGGLNEVGMNEILKISADQLFWLLCTNQFDGGAVSENEDVIGNDKYGIGGKLDQRAIAFFRIMQRRLGFVAFVIVMGGDEFLELLETFVHVSIEYLLKGLGKFNNRSSLVGLVGMQAYDPQLFQNLYTAPNRGS
jgi:hypothetical protein